MNISDRERCGSFHSPHPTALLVMEGQWLYDHLEMVDQRSKSSAAAELGSRSGMDRNRYKILFTQIDSVTALKLIYDDGDLRIQGLDRGDTLVVELRFRDVLLTRISPEGVRLRLMPELGEKRSLVLTDEQSELITWVLEEGLHTRDMRQAKHFLVFIGEEIVDVVSLSEPEVLSKRKMRRMK